MATEIELKVRVTAIDAFEAILRSKATFLSSYDKSDQYFRSSDRSKQTSAFRLRKASNRWYVTQKNKRVANGIETNDELEFEVSDGDKFTRMMVSLGFSLSETKTKVGNAYKYRDVLVEFGSVSNLGYFAEIELVFDHDASEDEVRQASSHLMEIVDELGLDRKAIEERPYSQLIKDSANSTNGR